MRIKETRGVAFVHTIISTVLIVLSAGCSQSGNQPPEPDQLSLQFEEELAIGSDTSASLDAQLASPAEVRTDNEGNIYVSDRGASEIKVFDAEGNFQHSIGQEGDGPGEFGTITAIEINNQDALIVMDESNQRATWFSTSGEVVKNRSLKEEYWAWPRYGNFRQLSDSRYISLRKMREIPGTTDPDKLRLQSNLLHLYDGDIENHIGSFAHIDILGQPDNGFIDMYMSTVNPGNVEPVEGGTLWYAPGIYDGQIYRFPDDLGGWSTVQTVQGNMIPKESVIVDSEAVGSIAIVTYTQKGTNSFTGYINSESLGLFQLADGRMVHISSQLNDSKSSRVTVVEVFSPEGELQGVGRLESFTYPKTDRTTSIESIYKDQDDRFYFVDTDGIPVVRVGQIRGI
ncbi:6-bladed beta-propeller [Aliifodinibius sp. S!AR15-10]|uniref:6-bladed beta-propeller n=1 Tax=Aliifodinibius sp. S!AR15-10 TaxID=2950437 RepID=UPI00286012EB|nr:6-bladed beta-propeller [Aliifodinibius sp. S!AR15-10]MDR8393852.1 6-bladed beta-propeller [Aliifodinibius sp. S!AR15-10]